MSASSVPKREKDPKKCVVITGIGGIGLIDRFDASKFPTCFCSQIQGFNSEGYTAIRMGSLLSVLLSYLYFYFK